MEKVVLGLADNAAELRQVAAEDAVAGHPLQLLAELAGAAEQAQKQGAVFRVGAELVVDQVAPALHVANGGGADSLDAGVFPQPRTDFQRGGGGWRGTRRRSGGASAACREWWRREYPGCWGLPPAAQRFPAGRRGGARRRCHPRSRYGRRAPGSGG